MQIDFITVLVTVLALVALAIPGFILAKTKMVGEGASSTISTIVLYVCQPALVFMGFQGKQYSPDIAINMLIVAGLTFVFHFAMTGIVFLFVRNKNNDAKINALRFASIFSNCGFMGMPMIISLFSGNVLGVFQPEAIMYSAVVIAVFNILSWTLGVYIITKDRKYISIKKILLNPTIIAVILGFAVFMIAQVPLVDLANNSPTLDQVITKLMDSINLIGNAVTPLSMFVIGIKLANVKVKQLLLNKSAYVSSLLKLVVMSLVVMLIVAFLPISPIIKYTVFFLMSMPSATSTTLFAVKFKGDAENGAVMVLLSSILCVATIPLMFLIFSGLFGVTI